MRLVSFDPFRSLHLPNVTVLKPEHWLAHRELLAMSDWVLFPGAWQLDTLEYALKCHVFPSAATIRLGFDKIVTTRAMQAAFPSWMPQTLIVANTSSGREEVLDTFAFPFVMKVPRESMGRGVQLIGDRPAFNAWCETQTVLYAQEYLPIQRDLRVVWIGDSIVCSYWREGEGFLNNVARGGRIVFDNAPSAALDAVATIARCFGIDHAGFDIAWLDGHPYLLEFNVLFGNQALTSNGIRLDGPILDWLTRGFISRTPRDPAPLPRSA